jgi:hypothetical protein
MPLLGLGRMLGSGDANEASSLSSLPSGGAAASMRPDILAHEGWLYKKGAYAMDGWKRRWCELRRELASTPEDPRYVLEVGCMRPCRGGSGLAPRGSLYSCPTHRHALFVGPTHNVVRACVCGCAVHGSSRRSLARHRAPRQRHRYSKIQRLRSPVGSPWLVVCVRPGIGSVTVTAERYACGSGAPWAGSTRSRWLLKRGPSGSTPRTRWRARPG